MNNPVTIPDNIIDRQAPVVQELYRHYDNFMRRNVRFNRIDSPIHSLDHTDRVLLHALILGHQVFGDDRDALHALAQAAVFHDTRRKDDSFDTGHGARAARYYEDYCQMNANLDCHPEVPFMMRFHDLPDEQGRQAIAEHFSGPQLERALLLYDVFKDADALDRPRLGSEALDPGYLRTPQARALVPFGYALVGATIAPDDLARTVARFKAMEHAHQQ